MEFLYPLRQRVVAATTRRGLLLWELQAPTRSWAGPRTGGQQQRANIHHFFRGSSGQFGTWRINPFRRSRSTRWTSSKPSPNPTEHLGSPEPRSLSARLKKLSREYGWSALGVYLSLSALDFPFCFLAVRWLGTDRIGRWEHTIVEAFWSAAEAVYPDARKAVQSVEDVAADAGVVSDPGAREGTGWGVEEAEARNKSDSASMSLVELSGFKRQVTDTVLSSGIWTQLALAYAIHKSFIFIRVPLTAAVTPKVVKILRGWGWDIGKRKPKPSK